MPRAARAAYGPSPDDDAARVAQSVTARVALRETDGPPPPLPDGDDGPPPEGEEPYPIDGGVLGKASRRAFWAAPDAARARALVWIAREVALALDAKDRDAPREKQIVTFDTLARAYRAHVTTKPAASPPASPRDSDLPF